MIFSDPYVFARMMLCTALANNNITCGSKLTTEYFYAKALAVRLATVLRTTNTFLMCHCI